MYVTFLSSRTTVVHNTTDRRSQVIITGQSVSSRSGYASEDNRSLDEEANYESGGPSGITPEGEDAHTRIHTSEHVNDDLMSELGWEEDTSTPLTGSRPASVPTLSYGYPRLQSESDYRRADKRWGKSKRPHVSTSGRSRGHLSLVSTSSERTPLLSPSTPDSGRTVTATSGRRQDSLPADYAQQGRQTLVRKPSAISTHSEKRVIGRSTFGQTVSFPLITYVSFCWLTPSTAFQFYCDPSRIWYAIRTSCICPCWMVWGYGVNCNVWLCYLLHVSALGHPFSRRNLIT